MKKVLKLLLNIILSITVMYFIMSNAYMVPNVLMASDFIKNGTEQDVVNYSKQTEEALRESLEIEEAATEEKEAVNDEETKKEEVKVAETTTEEEKQYETMNDIVEDYPMGATYYSVMMSMGEMQIQVICLSCIFGIIIGVNCFFFITDKKRNFKELAILFVINLAVAVVAAELVQILILIICYGTFAFVQIDMSYILVSIASFLFAFTMNKAVNDKRQQKLEEEKNRIKEQNKKKKK